MIIKAKINYQEIMQTPKIGVKKQNGHKKRGIKPLFLFFLNIKF
jgi:hypothetical protein